LSCDEKHLREHDVINVLGLIETTNYKTDGIYLPHDDRRHFVAWSDLDKDKDFAPDYWRNIYRWFEKGGGNANVAAYLRTLDLTDFDPKAPPPKTDAWFAIVNANRAAEDAELADVLDKLDHPKAVTVRQIIAVAEEMIADGDLVLWLKDVRNRRMIPGRMDGVGYTPVNNRDAKDGYWVIGGKRQAIYANKDLAERDRWAAAQALVRNYLLAPFDTSAPNDM
jgi:hypothetical protein